jgi:hypothetical protein
MSGRLPFNTALRPVLAVLGADDGSTRQRVRRGRVDETGEHQAAVEVPGAFQGDAA